MLKKYFLFLFFIISTHSFSQGMQLSIYSKISVITYGPGDALYEKFGHTAIRIQDPVLQLDLIYNYGIFDFTEENFYVNFTKGFMKYRLARYSFPPSLRGYNNDERWVKEQVLNLTVEQRNTFFRYLENNAKPENASYFYDPFFNNCSTKPIDIMKDIFGDVIVYKSDYITEENTIRELMNKEIHTNTWGSLGINIALGNRLDKTAQPNEYMYLPDYVFEALENSKIIKDGKEKNLVLKTNTLLDYPEKSINSDTFSPLIIFLILLILGLYISYRDIKRNIRSRWFDTSLALITGLFGVLIVFLWFFTNHSTAPNNFNFLWAFAPNFFLAFILNKKNPPKWISNYVKLLLILLVLIPIVWILGIQLFPYALIPLFILLAIRYWLILRTTKSSE
ncbi:lipoprotein N-acyltransferase Lnb domain-containing protein [Tenacibaculum xiamenense]|uniref:lipoprotein N-acyltransferase Lnb domain-containing protein n=1 Tax=Tenacibaculum xiamenense TaxID=1261553 RepID=UPI00389341ED